LQRLSRAQSESCDDRQNLSNASKGEAGIIDGLHRNIVLLGEAALAGQLERVGEVERKK